MNNPISPTEALKNDELILFGPKLTKSIGQEESKNLNEVKRRSVKDVSKRINQAKANVTISYSDREDDEEHQPKSHGRGRPKK